MIRIQPVVSAQRTRCIRRSVTADSRRRAEVALTIAMASES
jgi:hypothetical protein